MNRKKFFLPNSDVLLVLPPFGQLSTPSLGLHMLQAQCKGLDISIGVYYLNLAFANKIGIDLYKSIEAMGSLIGECVFATLVFEDSIDEEKILEHVKVVDKHKQFYKRFIKTRETYKKLISGLVDEIDNMEYKMIGVSTTFEQTVPSLYLLKEVKRKYPKIKTIIGGANCDGDMGDEISKLAPYIDYVFKGESDIGFREFIIDVIDDKWSEKNVISSEPVSNMEKLACPEFDDYFEQLKMYDFMQDEVIHLTYETSRGCWWGAKKHCTFCGLNANGMAFREKSADKALNEIDYLFKRHNNFKFVITDNIMPYSYHKTLIPNLYKKYKNLPDTPKFFYEQKANMKFEEVLNLSKAGVKMIQPGIESLSTNILKLMKKGNTAHQNIMLLRYSLISGIKVAWNFLYQFPNDKLRDYEKMNEFLKLITHLEPPHADINPVIIERFSPYFMQPKDYNISNIKPLNAYNLVFPKTANTNRLAYMFTAEFKFGSSLKENVIKETRDLINTWNSLWKEYKKRPFLMVIKLKSKFLLIDTRNVNQGNKGNLITQDQAKTILLSHRSDSNSSLQKWALENNYCIILDGFCTPLATTSIETYLELKVALQQNTRQKVSVN